MRVGVIGAGPAGLGAAYGLASAGVSVDVLESGPAVGGLAKTLDLWGRRVEIGSHILVANTPELESFWAANLTTKAHSLRLKRGIITEFGVLNYPFSVKGAIKALGPLKAGRCALDYAFARAFKNRRDACSADQWIVSRYGQRLFDHFFDSYGRKLFGVPCSEVDSAFAELLFGVDHDPTIWKLVRQVARGKRAGKASAEIPSFLCPEGGLTSLWDGVTRYVERHGGNVLCNTTVNGLSCEDGRVTGIDLGAGAEPYDWVVSSMPVGVLLRMLVDVPEEVLTAAKGIRTRATIVVYLKVPRETRVPWNWLYVYDKRFKVGRITNLNRWLLPTDDQDEYSIYSMEYWCDNGDEFWRQSDEQIRTLAAEELRSTVLTRSASVLDHHILRVPVSHPLYDTGFRRRLDTIHTYLNGLTGLSSIGRHGAFSLDGIGGAIAAGLEASREITEASR